MRNRLMIALWLPLLLLASGCPPPSVSRSNADNGDTSGVSRTSSPGPSVLTPPVAARVQHQTDVLGVTLHDDYYWLRDRENPAVIQYLEAENAYTAAVMAHTQELQDALYTEFVSHMKETDEEVPVLHGGYWYYSRTVQGQDYSLHCRRQGTMQADEQLLLDENVEAAEQEFFQVGTFETSPDHKLLAWSADTLGSERYTLRIRELATGKDLADRIAETGGPVAWASDNRTLFYVTLDDTNRPYRLWRHTLGTTQEADKLVYEETDGAWFMGISRTRSGAFIVMDLGSNVASEAWVLPADKPEGDFRVIARRRPNIEYSVEHHSSHFFIVTNDQAVNFRLVQAPVDTPEPENWSDVIPARYETQITGCDAFAHHLVISGREKGLPTITVRDLETGQMAPVPFDEASFYVEGAANPEFDTAAFRFSYGSLVTPTSTVECNLKDRTRKVLKEREVPGYDRTRYDTARVMATAPDGTQVPISLVHRKGLKLDGSNPCLIDGYGSYGYSNDPWFSSSRLSLLDRGFVFAVAHIRGGGEMGRPWYDAGKLQHKKNTFTDFIACADHLIAAGYTSRKKLAITGGSAGGLLMGAVINMRPDLCQAVVADVPFVDVINTMLDESIPLTVTEYEEWGNPHTQPAFDYMRSYAPYENVAAVEYPDMLVVAGLNDTRVGYWEPAKWVAKLRARKTGNRLLLLKTEMEAGHGGSSGRYSWLEDVALQYAFILDRLGVK